MYQSFFAPHLLAGQAALVGRNAEKLQTTQQRRAMCTTAPPAGGAA